MEYVRRHKKIVLIGLILLAVFTVIFGFMDHDNDITFHKCCGNAHKHSSGKSRPGIWKSSDTVHRYSLWSDRSCLLQQI